MADHSDLDAFSRKLTDLMARRGMSQSDVARAIWGAVVDPRGRDVARNRDRISNYVRGTQMPETKTLKKLAEVFGVPVSELQPRSANTEARTSDLSMVVIGGNPGMALLTVNRVVPVALAARIVALLAEAEAEAKK